MRKSLAVVATICLSLLSPVALSSAATKAIAVKQMSLMATLPADQNIAGAIVKASNIYVYGTQATQLGVDGFVSALDATGATKWTLDLHEGATNILATAVIDSAGTLTVFGSSSSLTEVVVSPSVVAFQNPDSVTVDVATPQRNDITEIVIWKISPEGQLISTAAYDLKSPVLVTGGTSTSKGAVIVGNISTASGMAGFFLAVDADGVLSKPVYFGKTDTELNAVLSKTTGFLIIGASSETISSKTLKGKRDGLLLSVNATGKVLSAVRSSNLNASRSWQSVSGSNFLGGVSRDSNKVEAVVTQFNANLVPTWTTRFPSLGSALTTDISTTSRAALFASTSTITGLTGWKASKGAGITLVFGTNGVLTGAYGATSINSPISLGYSAQLGLVAVGSGPKGVSVFHALPR